MPPRGICANAQRAGGERCTFMSISRRRHRRSAFPPLGLMTIAAMMPPVGIGKKWVDEKCVMKGQASCKQGSHSFGDGPYRQDADDRVLAPLCRMDSDRRCRAWETPANLNG
jgi:hypothetical protein